MTIQRVFLNVGVHPIYESLIKFPPKGVLFINYKNGIRENYNLTVYERKKNIIRKIIGKINSSLRIPRMFYFSTNADLIHTSRGIIPLNKKPWIMDIEHAKSFFDDHKPLLSGRARSIVRKFILSKYCKKILPHCIMSYKSLVSAFGEDIKEKLEVMYPAIKPYRISKKRKSSKIRLLFIANKFFEKGGKEVLEAFEILNKRYDVELIFKCIVPFEFKEKYKEYKNIKFIEENIPRKILFSNLYATSDVFIFPTYIDTFGFSLLEAMSVGLPIVANNIFAIPEIIEDGKNGFLIDAQRYDWADSNGLMKKQFLINPERRMRMYTLNKPEIVKQLIEKVSLLIENSRLRRRMGKYSRMLVEKGKFSIKERNKKLKEIYEEAIRY